MPTEFIAELVMRLPELSELYPYVRQIPVKSASGEIPSLATDISATWGRATEDTAMSSTDPVFGTNTFTLREVYFLNYTSRKLLGTALVDPGALIKQLFTEAIAAERDKMIAIGDATNSSQPQGIASATLGSTVTSTVLTYALLRNVVKAVAKKYRRNARWIMNNTNVARASNLVDNNNMPIFKDAAERKNTEFLLCGYPLSQQDNLPDASIYFGDLSYWWYFDGQMFSVETTTQSTSAFEKHQLGTKMVDYWDGKVMLAAPFAKAGALAS